MFSISHGKTFWGSTLMGAASDMVFTKYLSSWVLSSVVFPRCVCYRCTYDWVSQIGRRAASLAEKEIKFFLPHSTISPTPVSSALRNYWSPQEDHVPLPSRGDFGQGHWGWQFRKGVPTMFPIFMLRIIPSYKIGATLIRWARMFIQLGAHISYV